MEFTLNERQQMLLNMIKTEGEVRISGLRDILEVTEMTIRRDLEKLEQAGLVRRTFGGAIPANKDVALKVRSGVMSEEKIRIGKCAAQLIQAGNSVFIDGGTTTFEIARFLKPGLHVTVVTNALNIAMELMEKKISTLVTGGMVLETTSTLVGPGTVESIGKMAFDRIFLGTTGISAKHGFSNSNLYETEVKRMAIRQSTETNVVADHTKFGAKELFSFADLGMAHRILTDQLPDGNLHEACREASVELLLCE
jgi:DeoR/GlpR family transcriptional regulator of sugar metabolism